MSVDPAPAQGPGVALTGPQGGWGEDLWRTTAMWTPEISGIAAAPRLHWSVHPLLQLFSSSGDPGSRPCRLAPAGVERGLPLLARQQRAGCRTSPAGRCASLWDGPSTHPSPARCSRIEAGCRERPGVCGWASEAPTSARKRGVGLPLIDRPRRPCWAVKGQAGDDQRDTEDLQRRGHLGQEPTPLTRTLAAERGSSPTPITRKPVTCSDRLNRWAGHFVRLC